MEAIPWFKVYPAETLSDELFSGWSIEERGAWFTLILVNWREGSIPADQTVLARLLHVDSTAMRLLWAAIGNRFVRHPDLPDRLTSPRVEREREAAERLMAQKQDAGRKGANQRWGKGKPQNGKRMGPPCDPNADPMADNSDQARQGKDRKGLSVRWWEKLTPDERTEYALQRAAIDPDLADAPYGATGVKHIPEVEELHRRWAARVQRKASA